MLSSPITVTIGGTAHSLSRINQDNFSALYRKSATNLEIDCQIRHSYEKSQAGGVQYERHNVDLKYTTWDAEGNPSTTQVYTVLRKIRGSDPVTVTDVSDALGVFTAANVDAIVAWES